MSIAETIFRKPVNAGKPWSDRDDADLLDYDQEGYAVDLAAELLCREPDEVEARLAQLKPKPPDRVAKKRPRLVV
jgi:hypothetical protein